MNLIRPICRFVETEDLRIGYETHGPVDGSPVLLLHGWPDDVRAWNSVSVALAGAGYRTIAPYLRGFGPTRFQSASAPRTAQPTRMANDAAQLLTALGIERAPIIGHDWGGRIGYTLAALWPERVERLLALSVPYQTGIPSGVRLQPEQQHAYWYQWFFGSERGREALEGNRLELCRYLWQTWAPSWRFTEEEFAATASSWQNPDWVEITLHSYRVRWGNTDPDPRDNPWEAKLKTHPTITVPTTVLHGEEDGATLPSATADQATSFAARYQRRVLAGTGHFIPRENPTAVVEAFLQQEDEQA